MTQFDEEFVLYPPTHGEKRISAQFPRERERERDFDDHHDVFLNYAHLAGKRMKHPVDLRETLVGKFCIICDSARVHSDYLGLM